MLALDVLRSASMYAPAVTSARSRTLLQYCLILPFPNRFSASASSTSPASTSALSGHPAPTAANSGQLTPLFAHAAPW